MSVMSERFVPGDLLVFQIESGFGLIKVIGIDEAGTGTIWHLKAYRDLFMDIEMADLAAASPESLTVEIPHVAMTDRAFESTQVSALSNTEISSEESKKVEAWRANGNDEVSDRSVRLLLGLR